MKLNPNRKVQYSIKQIRKMKVEEYEKGQREALNIVNVFPLLVLRDKFGFGKKRLKRFSEEYLEVIDAYNKDYLDFYDVVKMMEEETGIDYSDFIEQKRRM